MKKIFGATSRLFSYLAAVLPFITPAGNQKAFALRVRCAESILLPVSEYKIKAGRRWARYTMKKTSLFSRYWINLRLS
ncbi:MAG: hypothetical protein MUO40_09035 [Anaerolineaceae bacterium]|nr:hypothetical protein [Anaerolineaceae bacterium]